MINFVRRCQRSSWRNNNIELYRAFIEWRQEPSLQIDGEQRGDSKNEGHSRHVQNGGNQAKTDGPFATPLEPAQKDTVPRRFDVGRIHTNAPPLHNSARLLVPEKT